MLKAVVFPAPFGPISPTISDSSTSSDRPSRARMPPKRRSTSTSSSSGMTHLYAAQPMDLQSTEKVGSPLLHFQKEETNGAATWRHRARFRGTDDRGADQLPRLDRRFVGRAVLAPEGLHPGLHDRAR